MKKTVLELLFVFSLLISMHLNCQTAFTSGNIVLLRVGDGSTTLSSSAFPVSLLEYHTASPVSLIQTVSVPVTTSGSNNRLTQSGTATSEGSMSLSSDGRYLFFGGYDAAQGTATVASSGSWNRIVARVDITGNINTSTSLTGAYSNNSFRSVFSSNGSDLWLGGNGSASTGGVRYYTFGSTGGTGTQLTTNANIRNIGIFNGQLYASSGASGITQVNTVGSGLTTTGSYTLSSSTILPGTSSATPSNPGAFVLLDMDPAVPGADLCYIADGSNGIFKFAFNGTSWIAKGSQSGTKAWGLTACKNPSTGNIRLYTITSSSSNNSLVYYDDQSAYDESISLSSLTTIASAGSNYVFRGVAFAPSLTAASTDLLLTSNQNISAGTYGDIHISSGMAALQGDINLTGRLRISAGAGIDCGEYSITSPDGVYGIFQLDSGGLIKFNSGISASSSSGNINTFSRFYDASADYYANGSVPDIITDGFPSEMHDFSINSSNGITLDKDLKINGTLYFLNGVISGNSNTITFSSGGSVNGASSSSYINGRVVKVGNANFTFPVGDDGIYKPLTISGLSNITDAYAARYYHSSPGTLYDTSFTSRASTLEKISSYEYWYLEHISGTDAGVTLYYDSTSYITSAPDIRMAIWNGSSWNDDGGTGNGCNANSGGYCRSGSITVNALADAGPVTFATAAFSSPLPLRLLDFSAKHADKIVLLSWSTANEHNTLNFDIEKSIDGIDFSFVGSVDAAGESDEILYYHFTDQLDFRISSVIYYRLRMRDRDGRFKYSKLASLPIMHQVERVSFSNPSGNTVCIQIEDSRSNETLIQIYNTTGALIISSTYQLQGNPSKVLVDVSELPTGLYTLVVTTPMFSDRKKLLISR
jgi:hypothetical protein